MRKRQSEKRFRDVGSKNGRTANAKLADAIFSDRRKRGFCVALLGAAFVVGGTTFSAFDARADEAAVAASRETATTDDAFEYKVLGNEATICGLRDEFRSATAIHIPQRIGDVFVRKIEPKAFEGFDRLEALYCDAYLTDMGERAFADCRALKSVRLRRSISTLGREAFAGCAALRLVEHNEIFRVGAAAFEGCAALEGFDCSGVENVEAGAFAGCRKIAAFEGGEKQDRKAKVVDGLLFSQDGRTLIAYPGARGGEVVLPESVVSIGAGAFSGGSVESVVLPKTLQTVGARAFADCAALKSVVGAPATLETLRREAFAGCAALERFDWPENLRTIETGAFRNCKSLASAAIKSVRKIGDSAFAGCSKLKTLELPSSTREIGAFAFDGTRLSTLTLPRDLETFSSRALSGAPLSKIELEEGNAKFKIGANSVLSADGKTFYYRAPYGIGIGLQLPDGVRVVVRGALADNCGLEWVALPDGVETVGEDAFAGCSVLRTVKIPASVRKIDDRFWGCRKLENIEVAEENATYKSVDGSLLSKDGKTLYRAARKPKDANRVAPEGVERIARGAFADDQEAGAVFLPETLKRIDAGAFENCVWLRSVNIPASVERLDETFVDSPNMVEFKVASANRNYSDSYGALLSRNRRTFYRLVVANERNQGEKFFEYRMPPGVNTIKSDAFRGAVRMSKVVLPPTLRTIESRAFAGASNLTSVTIPAGVERIEKDAFAGCNLSEVVLESSSAKFDKSAFATGVSSPTVRVAETTLVKENAERAAKESVDAALKADEEAASAAFEWQVAGAFAKIAGVRDKSATSIVIPETVGGLPVKSIGSSAFAGMRELKTLQISRNLETLEASAFENCEKLERVTFAKDEKGDVVSNLKRIDAFAFRNCFALKSFAAPDSLDWIAPQTFAGCSALETATFGKNLQLIQASAFSDCVSLSRVDLSRCEKLGKIDHLAFANCVSLASFEAPKSLRFIADSAFSGRTKAISVTVDPENRFLKTVDGCLATRADNKLVAYFGETSGELVVSEGVEEIGTSVFSGSNFETVRLPKSLRIVGVGAFAGNPKLKRVEIPKDSELKTIGNGAFSQCAELETFDWPKSLKTICDYAFSNCQALKSLSGATSLERVGAYAFNNCGSLATAELPSGLREIGASAFADAGLTAVKIPASVHTLGEASFSSSTLEKIEVEEGSKTLKVVDGALLSKDGKSLFRLPAPLKLTSYKIPDGVEIIERAALGGNTTLESVEIPASVASIETDAFYRCLSLKKISIPAKTENIGVKAFTKCDALEFFEIDPNNAVYKSENGALLSADGKTFYRIVAVERDSNAEPIVLEPMYKGDEPREIPAYKNSVYRVPDGVTTIGPNAFEDWSRTRNSFTEIVLPESLTKIAPYAFITCSRLETLRIPASVSSMGETSPGRFEPSNLFGWCDAMKTFEVAPENETFRSEDGMLLSADGKTLYGVFANRGRKVWKIPEGVVSLVQLTTSAKNATEIALPESLQTLGPQSIWYCQELTTITIPKNVAQIKNEAFTDCPKLAEVVLKSSATKWSAASFRDCSANATVRVEEDAEPETEAKPSAKIDVKPEDSATLEEAAKVFAFSVEGDEATIASLRSRKERRVKIPAKIGDKIVTKIAPLAFAGSRYLASVELPPTLREIGADAFAQCLELETLSPLPASLEVVAAGAFSGCSTLAALEVDPANNAFQSVDGVLLSKDGKRLCIYPSGKKDAEWQVPDGVETIERSAVARNAFLETVKFPWTLKTIEAKAFADCEKLAAVRFFPVVNRLETIGEDAFYNCQALREIKLPDGIRRIERRAFGSNALEKVEFYPVDLEAKPGMTIAAEAFVAPSLTAFEVPATLKSF